MNIRSKLSLTFVLLLLFGVTGVSSYSILFIRAFLLEDSINQMERDGFWMQNTLRYLPDSDLNIDILARIGRSAGYDLLIFDEEGQSLLSYRNTTPENPEDFFPAISIPDSVMVSLTNPYSQFLDNRPDSDLISLYAPVNESINQVAYFRITQEKQNIYQPIETIRWIIYTGMFISIGLIFLVSWLFSRHLSEPIIQLTKAAHKIAGGDIDHQIHLSRSDEFGTLAKSLNRMASNLRKDNERLQHINERQRQFFGDITHEVRNPLHTIMGSLELLEMKNLDDEKRIRYLKNARSQSERLSNLFKDLMTLQRYDADEYFIQLESFNIADTVNNVALMYQDEIEKKGLTFEYDKHDQRVTADPSKIEQVIENLVSNAIKFTSAGTISVRYSKQNDGNVCVEVSDTGQGIPENQREKLFDRFYRTDKARSRDKGGTGLGLAVVKSIIDAHDSEITVESESGVGTTFRFFVSGASPKPPPKAGAL